MQDPVDFHQLRTPNNEGLIVKISYISPAFSEEPPDLVRVFTALKLGIRCNGVGGKTFHDLHLGSIHLDVRWSCTMSRVIRIGTADIRDLEHHIGTPIFFPERDADILLTVAYATCQLLYQIWRRRCLRLRSAYFRKYG